ncbi:MAG: trimethylamine methyltransferase family protein [Anaerolineae bacterium]
MARTSACAWIAAILDKIKTAPSQFTLHARNPAHDHGQRLRSSPRSAVRAIRWTSAADGATAYADLVNAIKLSQNFGVIHNIGGFICENQDHHEATRHLDT